MDVHAQWKSKWLLAEVSLPLQCSIQPGETTARRVLIKRRICSWQSHDLLDAKIVGCNLNNTRNRRGVQKLAGKTH